MIAACLQRFPLICLKKPGGQGTLDACYMKERLELRVYGVAGIRVKRWNLPDRPQSTISP